MCIEEVKAWAYAGKHYNTERDALWAAIDEIAREIVKQYATNPGRGLVESAELPGLLIRYHELVAESKADTATESREGTRAAELEGTRAVLQAGDIRLFKKEGCKVRITGFASWGMDMDQLGEIQAQRLEGDQVEVLWLHPEDLSDDV